MSNTNEQKDELWTKAIINITAGSILKAKNPRLEATCIRAAAGGKDSGADSIRQIARTFSVSHSCVSAKVKKYRAIFNLGPNDLSKSKIETVSYVKTSRKGGIVTL